MSTFTDELGWEDDTVLPPLRATCAYRGVYTLEPTTTHEGDTIMNTYIELDSEFNERLYELEYSLYLDQLAGVTEEDLDSEVVFSQQLEAIAWAVFQTMLTRTQPCRYCGTRLPLGQTHCRRMDRCTEAAF